MWRERLAEIVAVSSDFVGIATPDGHAVYVNAAGLALTGFPAELPAGMPIAAFHPAWAARLLQDEGIPHALREGRWEGETALVDRQGHEIPVSQLILVLRDAAGAVEYLATVARPRVEEKRMLDELRHSEERFRRLIEDLHVGVVVQGPRAEILISNRRAHELLGLDEPSITGRTSYDPSWDVIREDGRPFAAEERPVATVQRTREPVRDVVMGILRPGAQARIWLLVTAIPEIAGDGSVRRVVATQIDITERKRLEESLQQAQRMETVGRLAGGVAHDFNNILSVIASCAALALRRLPEDSPARGELDEILAAGRHAASLTAQLLAFARRQVIEPRVLDANDAVRAMRTLLTRVLGETIALEAELGAGLKRVRVDQAQLEQVIVNLAVNARDAMPDGGRLIIATRDLVVPEGGAGDVPAGSWVELAVTDTGTGMDEATRARAFEPFFSTKEPGRGTGLGLAVVHGIVEQAQGSVRLESSLGQGTTVRVLLPAIDSAAAPSDAPEARRLDDVAGQETILVVEDEPALRRVVSMLLEDIGYRVLSAPGAAAALELSQRHEGPIHLLLSDVVLGGMNGEELAAALVTTRPTLRVLLVSGYAEELALRGTTLAPGRGFLQKPYTPDALAAKIRELLDA